MAAPSTIPVSSTPSSISGRAVPTIPHVTQSGASIVPTSSPRYRPYTVTHSGPLPIPSNPRAVSLSPMHLSPSPRTFPSSPRAIPGTSPRQRPLLSPRMSPRQSRMPLRYSLMHDLCVSLTLLTTFEECVCVLSLNPKLAPPGDH